MTWTLPFGLLMMFAVFNRFNKAYEEAARDLGASGWQTLHYVVLPIVFPSLVQAAKLRCSHVVLRQPRGGMSCDITAIHT